MKIISLHKQAYETSEWNKQDSFPSPPEKPTFTDTTVQNAIMKIKIKVFQLDEMSCCYREPLVQTIDL